ncbi:DUF6531 domain-containing protein, partial [Saccharospirillum alexandrii]|uniref:DUF6531 domain-containing protein n=1 Tax=Saccharospirillum alexandrii TaxID=2448477 RepID=UPI00319E740D
MMGFWVCGSLLSEVRFIRRVGKLLIASTLTILVACAPNNSSDISVDELLSNYDDHFSRVESLYRVNDSSGIVDEYSELYAIGQSLQSSNYQWSLGDGRVLNHLKLLHYYLESFTAEKISSEDLEKFEEYLLSEHARLASSSKTIRSFNNYISRNNSDSAEVEFVSPPQIQPRNPDTPDDPGCPNRVCPDPDPDEDDDSCDSTCRAEETVDELEQEFGVLSPQATEVVQTAIAAATANGEEITESLLDQIKDKARNIEQGKACGACSDDPVELPTGNKVTNADDGALPLLSLKRSHRISQQSAWSLGAGWHLSFDSRIILGVEPPALNDDIVLQTVAVGGLQAALEEVDSIIGIFEDYKGSAGYTHSLVDAKLDVILAELSAERAQIIQNPEQASDILVAARQKLVELQSLKARSDVRKAANQFVVDPANPAEAILGVDVIKWVAPSGSRVSFNDPESGGITPIGGHLNRLHRIDGGYRVETPDNRRYFFNNEGLLIRVEDTQGNHLTIERSGNQARALADQYGRRWSLQYNSDGQLETITDPENRTLTYGYDSQQRLTRVTGFDGSVNRYEYDYAANPLVITAKFDGEGNEAHYQFAQQSQETVITHQFDEDGYHWSYQYDRDNQVSVLTNRNGLTVTNRYNDDYKFTEKVYGASGEFGSEQFDYDAEGNLSYRYNELSEVTSFTHNARGQVQSVTDGEGRTTHYTRDQAGRILSETDPAGNTTHYRRDANGQIDRIEFPDGTIINEKWLNGLLHERIDQDGNITRWAYDDNGFAERIDYFGTVIGDDDDAFRLMTHDAVGRVQSLTEGGINTPEADWRTTQYFYYDAATARDLDHPVRIIDPDGREALYRYDGNNQVTYHRDFSGVETHYQYTPRRQVETKTIVMPNPQDANDHIEYSYHYQYDAEGNLERAEHPGDVVWFYEYDDRNRLERSGIEGTEVVRTLTYDLAGRIKTEDDNAGGLVEYWYYADGQVESQINPLGNVETYYYDARGDLDQVQDATRNAITRDYQRDALGRVTAVTDGEGHIQSLQLNGRGLTELTYMPNNPGQTRLARQYDWRGKVVIEQDITGGERQYRYNDFGELIQAIDAEGGVVDHEYDALGRKTKTIDAAGKVTLWEYDQQANRLVVTQTETDPSFTQVRSARTRTSERVYDLMGRLVAFTDAEHQQWHFEFNQQGLLTVTRNPDGSQIINDYNAAGQLVSETTRAAPGDGEPDRVTRYTRDAKGRVLTRQAPHYPASVVDQYDYNGLGQPVTISQAGLMSVTHQYDAAGRKTVTYYPENLSEQWEHDANDNITAYTDRDGYRWEYRYNADNNLTWAFDPIAVAQGLAYAGGQGTQSHYDDLGRPIGSTDPLGNRQSFVLDSEGRIIQQLDAYGNAIVTERDLAGRPTAITDRNGATTGYRYNAFGDLEAVTDALGNTTYTTYDRLGRAIQSTDALGNRVEQTYNHRAQLTSVTDPAGRTTEQYYNSFGNLTAVARPGPQGAITSRYDWRADNRLVQTTLAVESAPGATQHYEYDALGRMTGTTNELGHQWRYQYSQAGRVTQVSQPEAGTDIHYGYNGRGMVTERRYTDAGGQPQTDRLSYDGARRLASIANPALTESYAYDAAGRKTQVNNQTLNQQFELAYDANGKPLSQQVAQDTKVHYERDEQGRIIRIERVTADGDPLVFELERDAFGRVVQMDYPNNSRRRVSYDELGRINAIVVEQQGLGWGHHWKDWTNPWGNGKGWLWDKGHWNQHPWDGNQSNSQGGWRDDEDRENEWRSRRNGPWSDSKHWSWRRHGDHHTQWTAVETFEYRYDMAGNLIESERNGQRARFAYDSLNRLVDADYPGWDDIGYRWDDRANLVQKTTRHHRYNYQYDPANQLLSFESQRMVGFGCRNWFDWYRCSNNEDWRDGRQGWGWGSNHSDHSWGHDDRWDSDYQYEYDRNGYPTELSSRSQTQTFEHDALGRMVAVNNPNGHWVDYAYDSRDRRVLTRQGDGWRPEETDNQGEQGISHNGNNGRGGWGGWRHGRRDVHPWWDKYPHETEPLVLQSHYLDRQEQGQWRQRSDAADGESDWADYRSLTGLPMEEEGLPYSQILHQHLAEPYRWELKAGGMRGTDPRHLFLYGNHQGSTVQVRDGDGRGALRLDYSPFGQVFLKHSDRHHWSPA